MATTDKPNIASVALGLVAGTLLTLTLQIVQPDNSVQTIEYICLTATPAPPIVEQTPTPTALPPQTPVTPTVPNNEVCAVVPQWVQYVPYANQYVRATPQIRQDNILRLAYGGVMRRVYCILRPRPGEIWLAIDAGETQWLAYQIDALRSTPYGVCIECSWFDK